LTAKGVNYDAIDYLEEPLCGRCVEGAAAQRRVIRPQDAVRTNEEAYRQHVAGQKLSDEQLVRAMAKHPELIQRPIVVRGNKAVLARPVEKLTELGTK
jgi:arsenate reductase (glutaredoxin)